MSDASRRVSVLNFTALVSVVSIAAFASATPAGSPRLSDLGLAGIRPVTAFSSGKLQSMVALAALEASQRQPAAPETFAEAERAPVVLAAVERVAAVAPLKTYSAVEHLPDSGAVAMKVADMQAPHDATLPTERFTVHLSPRSAEEAYSAFARPVLDDHRAIALARLPQAKPRAIFAQNSDGFVTANPDVLAYAPAVADIDAPFDVVMSGARIVEEDGLYRPHPRPDPEDVLGWLDGRALGQFAPGQHDWVQNPLPPAVYQVKEQKCLAQGIYFEARGESEAGQAAVAQVILNRVRNPAYPGTICGVVYQDRNHRHACQFSFACDGRSEVISEQRQWETAQRIATDVTAGRTWNAEVGDSTHYHANYVRPGWGRRMIKVDRIGAHIFYRTRLGGWS